ncbi:MAG: glutamate--tRNA ligase [Planctomycetaceae bacterium]|jgi:glutamyl-tRNA synthetase|nr:glutamate--tRNA ligase [Planctomycetaceae bacterium]
MTVRTRFAPSPTGYMHIGGMRTALFNWLYARRHGGQFILRIDDTDKERNLDEALGPILQAFKWMGMDWDEGPEVGGSHGPYFQSERTAIYQKALEKLLAEGSAYKDFDPPEVIQADREAAQAEKKQYLNIRRSRELSHEQISEHEAEGRKHVVRLLVPRDEKVSFKDAVRGDVEFDCGLISDPVIARADGSPLYNFATTVDDADLEITHVIRAEEHLSNTPVQILIYQALGLNVPTFAHIPFVAAPGTKEKLSKRKLDKYRKNPQFKKMFEAADRVFPRIGLDGSDGLDPVMVEYYEKIGYLPDAVFNALARLGWSLDDKTEVMSRETIIENFSLERVVKSPAGLDPDKLDSLQQHWMRELPASEKTDLCLPYLTQSGLLSKPVSDNQRQLVDQVINVFGERLTTFGDILEVDYFFKAELQESDIDEKGFRKRVAKGDVPKLLLEYSQQLEHLAEWSASSVELSLQQFAESKEISAGLLIPALRICTTGAASGPDVYETLAIIGQNRCVERIQDMAQKAADLQL